MRFATLKSSLHALVLVAACDDRHVVEKVETKPLPVVSQPTRSVPEPTPPIPEPVVPVASGPVIPETFEERMKAGRTQVKAGKIDDSVVLFRAALELDPKSGVPHVEIARAYLVLSDVKRARPPAETAVELSPESSSAWNILGRVEFVDGDLEAAEASFERAVEENEDNTYAWNNLGLTRSKLGEWEEAIEALERATSGDRVEAYMWNNLGVAYEQMDRLIEARVAYEKAAKRHHEPAKLNIARLERGSLDDTAEVEPEDPHDLQ
jgi:Flp pilus assembly protein TadD